MWAYATRDVRLAVRGACSVCGGGFHFEIDPPYLCTGFQIDPLRDRSTISETGYSTLFICIRLSIEFCHQHLAFSGIMFAEIIRGLALAVLVARCQEISFIALRPWPMDETSVIFLFLFLFLFRSSLRCRRIRNSAPHCWSRSSRCKFFIALRPEASSTSSSMMY